MEPEDPHELTCPTCGGFLTPGETGHPFCASCLIGKAFDTTGEEPRAEPEPEKPTEAAQDDPTRDQLEGTAIGPGGRYKILQKIGEGGFGFVYMAEQTAPVHRRVAVKILKAGMDTRQVVARFEAERQALAMMEHPNIARVLDGGETAQGRPFFVMELVRGTPVTKFCDREALDTRARLQLFLTVCRAVQHAHQKGVIHRDLKPANILVTIEEGTEPVPKVIDFGVAKAMETPLTDKTLFTRFEQMIGTPTYMSPEQAGSDAATLDIDTRTDIYALGVLLYELLTGTTPFEAEALQRATFDEIRRILREDEAPRPSARLHSLKGARSTTIAKNRSAEAPGLGRQLRGDLDWIVMKAIDKDRRRRYETANAMASDVKRFLDGEAVVARPPSTAYRLGKFARRHKALLGTLGSIAVILTAASVISISSAIRAHNAEEETRRGFEMLKEQQAKTDRARQEAVFQRNEALRNQYVARLVPIADAWERGSFIRLTNQLDQLIPKQGEPEQRGWEWAFFREQCEDAFHHFPGHHPTWHPTRPELATVDVADGPTSAINLRTPDGGSLIRVIAGLPTETAREITSMHWSANGQLLAYHAPPARITVLDSESGEPVFDREIPPPDETLAVAGLTGVDLAEVAAFDLSPDGRTIATAHTAGLVQLWDTGTGEPIRVLHDPESITYIRSLRFSPASGDLVAALRHGVRLSWEVAGGERFEYAPQFPATGHVAWNRSGTSFAATGEDGFSVYRLREREPVATMEHRSARGTSWVADRWIVSSGIDHTIRVWDAETGEILYRYELDELPSRLPGISADGKFVSLEVSDGIRIIPVPPVGRRLLELEPGKAGAGEQLDLAWDRLGRHIAAAHHLESNPGGDETGLTIWDSHTGEVVAEAVVGVVRSMGWSHDGTGISAIGFRGTVYDLAIGDSSARSRPLSWAAGHGKVEGAAFYGGGQRFAVAFNSDASSGMDAATRLIDATSNELIVDIPSAGNIMRWSHDSRQLATGGWVPLALWKTASGHQTLERGNLRSEIKCIAWSPDDEQIALGRVDGRVHLIRADSAHDVAFLEGHSGEVIGVDWSDYDRIASASRDGTVWIWDATTGAALVRFRHPGGSGFQSVAWSRDGRRLAAGDRNGRVFVFGSNDIKAPPTAGSGQTTLPRAENRDAQ